MSGKAGDEEAAWRDLVASYCFPAGAKDVSAPWPARENLAAADTSSADEGGAGPGGAREAAGSGPESRDQPPPAGAEAQPGLTGEPTVVEPRPAASVDPVPGVIPAPPQQRIVRPAHPAPLPDSGEDEHYVPPVPPPLPRLDPVSKIAWLALFGGPGYLLLSVMAGWSMSGVAAFCAVAAFVGGFATLVARMDERPPNGSGPDDGAVV